MDCVKSYGACQARAKKSAVPKEMTVPELAFIDSNETIPSLNKPPASTIASQSASDGFVQQPSDIVNAADISSHGPTSGSECLDFLHLACSSSPGSAQAVVADTSGKSQCHDPECGIIESEQVADQTSCTFLPVGRQQELSPYACSMIAAQATAPKGPMSPLSSHFLVKEQHRIDIRSRLLRIYYEFLESNMVCWLIEKNCPFVSKPVVAATDIRNPDWSNRLVTRVCKLDESLYMAKVLSQGDRTQASKCLTLAMMTLAAQSTYLTNKDGGFGSQAAPRIDNFERNMRKSLWQQTNLSLGEAMVNTSFKVIYTSIIFSVTRHVMDADDGFLSGQNELALLQKISERDANTIYLDVALRKLHQFQRIEFFCRDGHARSEQTQCRSPDDWKTYAVVFWLAIMFDSMAAAINCKPFVLGDVDTDLR